jgi:hypothetical protein
MPTACVRPKQGGALGKGLAAVVAATVFFHAAHPAKAAEPARTRLRYERGPLECPDEASFRVQVLTRLGYDPFVDDATSRVELRFKGGAKSATAELQIVREDGVPKSRRMNAESCESLATSVATTLAMALDPISAQSPHPTPTPTPTPASPPASPPAPAAPAAPPPVPSVGRAEPPPSQIVASPDGASEPWAGRVLARASVGAGEVPGISLGGGIAFEVVRSRLGFIVDGLATMTPSPARAGVRDRVDASLVLAGPGACVVGVWGSACLHVRAGSVRVRAETVVTPVQVQTIYAEAGASGRLKLELSPAAELFAQGELFAPLRGASLEVDGQAIWASPMVGGRIAAGVAAKIF